MEKLVLMSIICWVPATETTLKESWRIVEWVRLDHCLTMNQVSAQGGQFGVITVRCENITTKEGDK